MTTSTIVALEPIPLADTPAFSAALGTSFERHGFAVVEGHGLDEARVARALGAAKAFFALPEAVKRAYVIERSAGQRGYTPFARETAKGERHADLKEFWHVGQNANLWPVEVEDFRDEMLWLFGALESLGARLMGAIADHLEVERAILQDAVRGGDSILRLLHYPPSDFGGEALRAGAHEDINAITLLLGAEEAGLEILDREEGWRPVNPPPDAVVVNVGDMLARLTNDVLPSTTHRVVNPNPDRAGVARFSTPFFLHFRPEFMIRTLPECVSPRRPNRYPEPVTARAYLEERLREIGLK